MAVCWSNTQPWREDISNDPKHINLGRVIRALSNYLESTILQRKILFKSGKLSRQLTIFPGVDVPASSPQGEKAKSYISDSTGLS